MSFSAVPETLRVFPERFPEKGKRLLCQAMSSIGFLELSYNDCMVFGPAKQILPAG